MEQKRKKTDNIYSVLGEDMSFYMGYSGSRFELFIKSFESLELVIWNWMLVKNYVSNNSYRWFMIASWEMIIQEACEQNWFKKYLKTVKDFQKMSEESIIEDILKYLFRGEGFLLHPDQYDGGKMNVIGKELYSKMFYELDFDANVNEDQFNQMVDQEARNIIDGWIQKFGFDVVRDNYVLNRPLLLYQGIHILKFAPLTWFDEWVFEYNHYELFKEDIQNFFSKYGDLVQDVEINKEEYQPFFQKVQIS